MLTMLQALNSLVGNPYLIVRILLPHMRMLVPYTYRTMNPRWTNYFSQSAGDANMKDQLIMVPAKKAMEKAMTQTMTQSSDEERRNCSKIWRSRIKNPRRKATSPLYQQNQELPVESLLHCFSVSQVIQWQR